MNYEGTTFQFIIEELHSYKTSFFFQLHLFTVIFLAIAILYVYYQQRKIGREIDEEKERRSTVRYCQKVTTDEYVDFCRQKTQFQLNKLKTSQAFAHYMQNKSKPNSFYNREMEDVSSIVFSDEEEQENSFYKNKRQRSLSVKKIKHN